MSKDQMHEVYPVLVNYVDGEKPTANKLNGILKQTKSSFDTITKAVGDPQDAQDHGYTLSPTKIGVPSLARMIGPSDYISPVFVTNDTVVPEVTLSAGRNSWSLGFPLVQTTGTITPSSDLSDFTPISGITGSMTFSESADNDLFADEKTSRAAVVERGDYYVDYYRGEIVTFEPTVGDITIQISFMNVVGTGAPWTSQNVIPSWEETTTLCWISSAIPAGSGLDSYTLTLPSVSGVSRAGTYTPTGGVKSKSYNDSEQYDVVFNSVSGQSHDLPYSLIAAGLSAGDEIPEGFCLLWDDSVGRVVPGVTFKWKTSSSLTLVTATGLLAESTTDRYRLIVTGSSLAETVGWLMSAFRDNRHVGLSDGALVGKTISFTNPISHKEVTERYNGYVPDDYTRSYALLFRESSLPTNEHPQYLHRYGWASDDEDGNSANAMRGNIVFTGSDSDMPIGTSGSSGNYAGNTYGILWGGGSTNETSGNSELSFKGGEGLSTWTSGVPDRFVFASPYTGGGASTVYGALTYRPWLGTPLYLRGQDTTSSYDGAMLGFDLRRQGEFNYIKLFEGYRTNYDPDNSPAEIDQGSDFNTPLSITPGLTERLAAEQVREFRLRGVPYLSSATNDSNSLGDSSRLNDSEFEHSFTSPGMAGADFLNVYSNAIFFSDDGDGSRTSFTVHGKDWLDGTNTEDTPTGIYYVPAVNSAEASVGGTIWSLITTHYVILDGTSDLSDNYKAGEYVQFEVSSSNKKILRIKKSGYDLAFKPNQTYLMLVGDPGLSDTTTGDVKKRTNGYFSLYNNHSYLDDGSSEMSLSCGVNHGFAYTGSKFLALSGYRIDGSGDLLSSFALNALMATGINDNTIIADSTLDRNVGIYSYDGKVQIGAWNSYDQGSDGDAGRHVYIYTSAFDDSEGVHVGNVYIAAGLGLSEALNDADASIDLTAYNDISMDAENGYLIGTSKEKIEFISTDSDISLNSQNSTKRIKAESSGYVQLKSTKTGGSLGIQIDSVFGIRMNLDSSGNDHRFYFKNTSSSDATFETNNGLIILGGTGLSLSAETGNILMNSLPTEDPEVSDALWNDSGTLKVSAG